MFSVRYRAFPGKKEEQTCQYGNPVIVERRSCVLKGLHPPGEEEEGKDTCGT